MIKFAIVTKYVGRSFPCFSGCKETFIHLTGFLRIGYTRNIAVMEKDKNPCPHRDYVFTKIQL